MKKLLIVIMIFISFYVYGEKTKKIVPPPPPVPASTVDKTLSLGRIFSLSSSDITVIYSKNDIILQKADPIKEYDLSYQLGFIFGTLNNYFKINGIYIIKIKTENIIFRYKDINGVSHELSWTMEEAYDVIMSNINERTNYIQQMF